MSEQDAINRIKNIKLIDQTDYEANSECIDELIEVIANTDLIKLSNKLSSNLSVKYVTISDSDAPKLFKHGYHKLCFACAWFNGHSTDVYTQYQSDQRDGAWITIRSKKHSNTGSNLR